MIIIIDFLFHDSRQKKEIRVKLSIMTQTESNKFSLENFEGPLDFLLHLIQKHEIDIYDVSICKITEQYLQMLQDQSVDDGAEFIGTTASLLWLKSKMLLPKHEQVEDEEIDELDPRFEVIHKLIEYCRFKEAAQNMTHLEQRQSGVYSRQVLPPPQVKVGNGIEHLSMDDVARMFQKALDRSVHKKGLIKHEFWKVSDKIQDVRSILRTKREILFSELFSSEKCKDELIVTFLAVLEIMKLGEGLVVRNTETDKVMIIRNEENQEQEE